MTAPRPDPILEAADALTEAMRVYAAEAERVEKRFKEWLKRREEDHPNDDRA